MRLVILLLLAGLSVGKPTKDHWRSRWARVNRLARLPQGQVLLKLRDADPRVREEAAWACFLAPDQGNATLLGLQLKRDTDPAVRRACARALVHFRDRRAVSALLAALARETDLRTKLFLVQTLRELTPAPCLTDAAQWTKWWQEHEHDPRFQPADEVFQEREYDGVRIGTRTVAPIPGEHKPKRKPPHILVLPQFGWTTATFGPYLLPLREHAYLTWVRLPTLRQLTGRSGFGDDIPTYPVDRLVNALEQFRAERKIKRFVILAHGASGWIAMRYAVRHRDQCKGLILIDTALDKEAYSNMLHRAAARGTRTERWVAKTLTHQNNVPFNARTRETMHAISLEHGYEDKSDLEIAWLYHRASDNQGFATVPDIKWSRHRKLHVPSLFLYSAATAFSTHHDANRIQRHFVKSMVAPIKDSRGWPFVEQNEKFHEIVAHFLRRFELIG